MYQWLVKSVVTRPLISAIAPKTMKSQQMIVIDSGRRGIGHRLYGSVANCTPVKECAATERKDSETTAAQHQQLISSGRRRGHHLSWSCTLLIGESFSVCECCFQSHATSLECLELGLQTVF